MAPHAAIMSLEAAGNENKFRRSKEKIFVIKLNDENSFFFFNKHRLHIIKCKSIVKLIKSRIYFYI